MAREEGLEPEGIRQSSGSTVYRAINKSVLEGRSGSPTTLHIARKRERGNRQQQRYEKTVISVYDRRRPLRACVRSTLRIM